MAGWNVVSWLNSLGMSTPVSAASPLPVTVGTASAGGGYTQTDRTVTSATGASQVLMAANASRKAVLIKNGAANAGINLAGGTALIGGAGTITLAPFEGLYLEGAACPVGAITAITTAAAYISAIEYT